MPASTSLPAILDLRVNDYPQPHGVEGRFVLSWRQPGNASRPSVVTVTDAAGAVVTRIDVPEGEEYRRVAYDGPRLAPCSLYTWQVDTEASGTRHTASGAFSTGRGDEAWQAQWISPSTWAAGTPLPVFSSRLSLSSGSSALLVLCGLGHATAWINGDRATHTEFDPPMSDYTKSVYYSIHDVSSHIRGGINEIEIEVARGWYALETEAVWEFAASNRHASPRLLAELWVDGRMLSGTDESWTWSPGPIARDSIYGSHVVFGSTLNERITPRPEGQAVSLASGPLGELRTFLGPHERVIDTLAGEVIVDDPGRKVIDFGRVVSGWTAVTAESTRLLTVRHGETFDAAHGVDTRQPHIAEAFQTDFWVPGSEGQQTMEARYGLRGFRYAEVTGDPGSGHPDVVARVVHADLPITSSFRSSSAVTNRFHVAAVNSLLINLHGIPTDTPTYEQNGWLGDGHLTVESALINFRDAAPLYSKWVQDLMDAEDASGQIPVIAPTSGWGRQDGVEWAHAIIAVPWALYKYRGDTETLRASYDAMVRHIRYASRNGDTVDSTLGDWSSPGYDELAPEGSELTAQLFVARGFHLLERIARVLNRDDDAREFRARFDEVSNRFNRKYLDRNAGTYSTASGPVRQTSQVLPLAFSVARADDEAAIAKALNDMVLADGIGVGILGEKWLLPMLSRFGYEASAGELLRRESYPSWGYMTASGDQTLWESWNAHTRTRSHHMHGTSDRYLFEGLAGIMPRNPGYERVSVRPAIASGFTELTATVSTPRGDITVGWETDNERVVVTVSSPVPWEFTVPTGYGLDEPGSVENGWLRAGDHRLVLARLA